jgi:8-amino-7-oxononanoate synthase
MLINYNLLLHKKIIERENNQSLRQLNTLSKDNIDFFSNDYLGIASQKVQIDACLGSTGARLISGNYQELEQLESTLASFFQSEDALLYHSGYDANVGLLSCIAGREDTIILDKNCHASLIDGASLSKATVYKFEHNDLERLKTKLSFAKGNIFVVVESVYSMDGDESPLLEIATICAKYNAALIVDEAHSTGIYAKGCGKVVELNLQNSIFARIHTFGKAFGCQGAIVAGSSLLKNYLINFSRPFIYTTAIAPFQVKAISLALNKVENAENQRIKLFENIHYFKSKIKDLAIQGFIESNSSIQSLVVSGNQNTIQLAKILNESFFSVKPILSPTVEKGSERIRICLHSFNTKEEIDNLLTTIKNYLCEK